MIPSGKSTALIVVNKSSRCPYFESCMSSHRQLAVVVYSDIAKSTKLKMFMRIKIKPKQLYYQLVVDSIAF